MEPEAGIVTPLAKQVEPTYRSAIPVRELCGLNIIREIDYIPCENDCMF
jgi:hypothetical protein